MSVAAPLGRAGLLNFKLDTSCMQDLSSLRSGLANLALSRLYSDMLSASVTSKRDGHAFELCCASVPKRRSPLACTSHLCALRIPTTCARQSPEVSQAVDVDVLRSILTQSHGHVLQRRRQRHGAPGPFAGHFHVSLLRSSRTQ